MFYCKTRIMLFYWTEISNQCGLLPRYEEDGMLLSQEGKINSRESSMRDNASGDFSDDFLEDIADLLEYFDVPCCKYFHVQVHTWEYTRVFCAILQFRC